MPGFPATSWKKSTNHQNSDQSYSHSSLTFLFFSTSSQMSRWMKVNEPSQCLRPSPTILTRAVIHVTSFTHLSCDTLSVSGVILQRHNRRSAPCCEEKKWPITLTIFALKDFKSCMGSICHMLKLFGCFMAISVCFTWPKRILTEPLSYCERIRVNVIFPSHLKRVRERAEGALWLHWASLVLPFHQVLGNQGGS